MSRFASLSNPSQAVRGLLQAELFNARKRKNKSLGSEFIPNGDFSTSTGWTVTGESTINAGNASVISTAGVLSSVDRAFTGLRIGHIYRVRFSVTALISGGLEIDGVFGTQNIGVTPGIGVKTLFLKANAASGTLSITRNLNVNGGIVNATIDNVSVRKVG